MANSNQVTPGFDRYEFLQHPILKEKPPYEIELAYQNGYADGLIDGKREGFKEGLQWATGK